jgi:hypothetical protein
MTTATTPTVPIGPTTVVGYGGTVVGLIASILALIFPNGDEQTIALIASSVFTLGSFLVTQIGRYMQAKEMLKRPPMLVNTAPPPFTASSGSGSGVELRGSGLEQTVAADFTRRLDPDRPKDPAVDLVGDQDLPEGYEEDPPPDDDSAVPDDPNNR